MCQSVWGGWRGCKVVVHSTVAPWKLPGDTSGPGLSKGPEHVEGGGSKDRMKWRGGRRSHKQKTWIQLRAKWRSWVMSLMFGCVGSHRFFMLLRTTQWTVKMLENVLLLPHAADLHHITFSWTRNITFHPSLQEPWKLWVLFWSLWSFDFHINLKYVELFLIFCFVDFNSKTSETSKTHVCLLLVNLEKILLVCNRNIKSSFIF